MKEEKLFRAIGDVGGDLIDMAEKQTFAPSPWRRWGSIAACLAVLVGLAALAMPYLQTDGGAASTADTTASIAAPQMEDGAYMDSADAEDIPADAGSDSAELPEEEAALEGLAPLAPREQLVFQGVIYYVEALYTDEEAQSALGAYLGTVEDADEKACVGEAVYQKSGSQVRDEDGLPLEIFVLVEDGYLYCLTYYASAGAYCTFDQAVALWESGEEALLDRFVTVMETMPEFSDPSELTADQLIMFFLLTLDQQAENGYRSRDLYSYLWFLPMTGLPEISPYAQDGGCYVIPLEDITAVLDRYLDGYTLDPSELTAYQGDYLPEYNALVLSFLPSLESGVWLRVRDAGLSQETQTIFLTVERYKDEECKNLDAVRQYTIRFEDGCCYYDSIAGTENA